MVSSSLVIYFIDNYKKDKCKVAEVGSFEVRAGLKPPVELTFVIDNKIEAEIAKCVDIFNKFVNFILFSFI